MNQPEQPLPIGDLYKDAIKSAKEQVTFDATGFSLGVEYWIAWYAARRGIMSVLSIADTIGLTPEQKEALRARAAEVAPD